ncbi:hypothetical protein A2118_01830 [Candidatus Kaiserbacteria bacterium GWA2_50_9]|uniref:Sortase n=1 Tax=Candidatus Kaiserbacteria bacterium GWA2_50_9 TaxID=1798474 RepID=A0A1F6BS58_9BACT|nr:MAG: hypothetical protein A2118_01830 [Candidatus Kaiserbacteria bacterium GWA2_50_9]
MKEIIELLARLIRVGRNAYARKWSFLGLFAVMFIGSVGALASLGLLPEMVPVEASIVETSTSQVTLSANVSEKNVVELPIGIEITAISLLATIVNPVTTDIETLDEKLLSGAVRYPTSAKLGEVGNVVLFGHSSYLPIVGNQAYKTFNGIQKLVAGDVVTVSSSGTAYTYRVRSVTKESAASNAGIELAVAGRVLTLATCNSFGAKADRFVVTADFVESHPAGS